MKSCRIVWKEGKDRFFSIYDEKELEAMKCSEAVDNIIDYEALEHEFNRHRNEIDHVECDGEKYDPELVVHGMLGTAIRLSQKVHSCSKKLDAE